MQCRDQPTPRQQIGEQQNVSRSVGAPLSPAAALRVVVGTLLLGLALTTSACGGPDWPKCENDDHCKEDADDKVMNYVCVFGQCQECGRDADCKDGKKCKKNRCMAPCTSDGQCGAGEACNTKTGDCVKASLVKGKAGDKCVETGDCQKGFVCYEQACMTQADADKKRTAAGVGDGTAGAQCTATADCKGGLVCYGNKCMSEEEAEMAQRAAAAAGGAICEGTRVFFAFNLHDLNPEARQLLEGIAKCLSGDAKKKIVIEGHADERGTTQYNIDLGERRARSVKEYIGRLGVAQDRIRTVSFGEEKPLEDSSTEDAWSLNRRGEIKFE